MDRLPDIQFDIDRSQSMGRQGHWRFILLILVFNILLVTTLLLSMQHQELTEELQVLIETRTVYEETLIIREQIRAVTVTVVVAPDFTPQPTSTVP